MIVCEKHFCDDRSDSHYVIVSFACLLLASFGPYYVILGSTSQLIKTSHTAVVVIYPEYSIFRQTPVLSDNREFKAPFTLYRITFHRINFYSEVIKQGCLHYAASLCCQLMSFTVAMGTSNQYTKIY